MDAKFGKPTQSLSECDRCSCELFHWPRSEEKQQKDVTKVAPLGFGLCLAETFGKVTNRFQKCGSCGCAL